MKTSKFIAYDCLNVDLPTLIHADGLNMNCRLRICRESVFIHKMCEAEYLRFKSDKIVNPVFNKDFEKECLFTPMEPM
jgi:hypothetical protein